MYIKVICNTPQSIQSPYFKSPNPYLTLMVGARSSSSKSKSNDLIEIVKTQLDLSKYTEHVLSPSAGAITTFKGTTRDTFNGRCMLELRYESYVPIAHRQIGSIVSIPQYACSLICIAVAHRLCLVPVGEASMFVETSSAHRSDAIEACRYVIDDLKVGVSIWKKEVYKDGEVLKENREFFERKKKDGCGCRNKIRVDGGHLN